LKSLHLPVIRAFPGSVVYAEVEKGLFAEALADIENSRRLSGDEPWIWSALAYAHGRAGQPGQARRALGKLKEMHQRHQIDPAAFVVAYAGMRDKEQTFVWLEKAYSQHSNVLTTLKVDPMYDELRSDPRFQSLLHRVGLAQ